MRVGVDVGGTNTDAVLMSGFDVLAAVKTGTTADVTAGVVQAIREVLREGRVPASKIDTVMIGTTHFTNALVERKRLLEVGVIRLGAPATLSLPPFVGWPAALRESFGRHSFIVRGGCNFDGSLIASLDEEAIQEAAVRCRRAGLRSVAISSVFSPVKRDSEENAREIVARELPGAHITLSSDIGRIGLLERENAAILNASLADIARHVVYSFRRALLDLNIAAPFFISQNDGTLMTAEAVERFPVLTIASGPTNSMRGAAFLTRLRDAIIVDIGGTTSDVGMVTQGFPRESAVSVDIGGVRTNFRMPDVLAIGLGGGSRVRRAEEAGPGSVCLGGKVVIGPDSVGYELTRQALVFGGPTLTLTDVAVAAGVMQVGDRSRVGMLEPELIEAVFDEIHLKLEDAIDRIKTSAAPVDVVLVGGGSALVRRPLRGAGRMIVPDHAGVANAIGAAIAQVGAEVDRVVLYEKTGRDAAIAVATEEARDKARAAGAGGNITVSDIEEVPLSYVPGGAVRLRVKAVGDLLNQ